MDPSSFLYGSEVGSDPALEAALRQQEAAAIGIPNGTPQGLAPAPVAPPAPPTPPPAPATKPGMGSVFRTLFPDEANAMGIGQPAPAAPPPPPPQPEAAAVGIPGGTPQPPPAAPAAPPAPEAAPEAPAAVPAAPAAPSAQPDALPTPPIPPYSPTMPKGVLYGPSGPQMEAVTGPQDPTAGISNNVRNNPLNLRFAGQDGARNAGGFAAFPTMQAGLQAAQNQMSLYGTRDGINTITGLVSKWAPPSENDTLKYIEHVSRVTGIPANAKINLADPAVQAKIIPAMSIMENGPVGKGGAPSGPTPAAPDTAFVGYNADVSPQGQQGGPPQGTSTTGVPPQLQMPYPNAAQPRSGDAILALASGLLSGPTFGRGLGEGLKNMVGINQQDRQSQMQMNQNALTQQYHAGLLGQGTTRLGIAQQNADTHRDQAGAQANTALGRLQLAQQQLQQRATQFGMTDDIRRQAQALQQQKLAIMTDSNVKADLADGSATGKAAAQAKQQLLATRESDDKAMADTNEALNQMAANPSMYGPSLTNNVNRMLATQGITSGAADLQATQKALADNRTAYLNSVTGGHMGMLRSFAADKFFSQAVADVTTKPEAAAWILQMQQHTLAARQAWREQYQTLASSDDPASRALVGGSRYQLSQDQFYRDFAASHPMPEYHSSSGAAPAAPAAPASNTAGPRAAPATANSGGLTFTYHP